MSTKVKRRKISMEPVLQDFTITSFSDLQPDVPGPSDSSVFEEIKNYDVEEAKTSFNKTDDINLSSGPFPSDSSLDSLFKQLPNSKTNTKGHRLFQKWQRKKSVENSLFDSCLKNSISDQSTEKIHKPFQRRTKNSARLSMFDSDFDSNTPIKDSPFKKPFQQKSKNKQKLNLFDSLTDDSQPNTPDPQIPRPLQRKAKKKISSNFFDDVMSSDNSNQPTPVETFITKRKTRKKKMYVNNPFDDDLVSSQTDTSMLLQPMCQKQRSVSTNMKNNSGMFDDLLDAIVNESQNDKSSWGGSCNKSKDSKEHDNNSFNLEYNEETGNNSESNDCSRYEETADEETDQQEGSEEENENEFSNQKSMSEGDETLIAEESYYNNKSTTELLDQKDLPVYEVRELIKKGETFEIRAELTDQHALLSGKNLKDKTTELETDKRLWRSEENGKKSDAVSELSDKKDTCDGYNRSRVKNTKEPDREGEMTRKCEGIDNRIKSKAEKIKQSDLLEDRESNKLEENCVKNKSISNVIDQQSFYINNPKNEPERKEALESNSTKDPKANDVKNQYNVNVADTVDEVHLANDKIRFSLQSMRSSLHCRNASVSIPNVDDSIFKDISSKQDCESSTMTLIHGEIPICTPDISFKDMPSSTPNVKTKKGSFSQKEPISESTLDDAHGKIHENLRLSVSRKSVRFHDSEMYLKNERLIDSKIRLMDTCVRDSIKSNTGHNENSMGRKSLLRNHKGNNDSKTGNNLTADNSISMIKRRVSFKVDGQRNNNGKPSNFDNSDKLKLSKGNQSDIYYSSISLESLVFEAPSKSGTSDSESVYIDIHPSRSKSTSESNTESFNNNTKTSVAGYSASQDESISFQRDCNFAGETGRCENEEVNIAKIITTNIETIHEDNNSNEKENKVANTYIDEELSGNDKGNNIFSKVINETSENEAVIENELSENEAVIENESEAEEEEEEEKEESEESEGQDSTTEEELECREQESESQEEVDSGEEEFKETAKHNENSRCEGFDVSNHVTSEKDENVHPDMNVAGEYKFPFKSPKQIKKVRTSSIFKEKLLDVPSKTQLQDILNKIPFSELKKRNKRKSREHCISKEQMQQYEIEEQLIRNQHQKKNNNKETFSASNKLKRPKQWVSPKLYEFLISKLKPQYRIRSRVRAEELVLFLVKCVDCIMKKNELMCEDVDEMKNELARLDVVKTHWDFYKFVNQYFDYDFKEKMYPSRLGKENGAFKFGPSNVLENIL